MPKLSGVLAVRCLVLGVLHNAAPTEATSEEASKHKATSFRPRKKHAGKVTAYHADPHPEIPQSPNSTQSR